MEIRRLHDTFGAEIVGIPPDLQVSDDEFRWIEQAWFDHSILLFRGLSITPEQHIAFTKRFGPLHIMKEHLNATVPGRPEVFVVSNAIRDGKAIGLKRAGEGFHTDGEDKRIPNAGSFLYAIEVPPKRGDTLFVDMYSVYDALPAHIKRQLSATAISSCGAKCAYRARLRAACLRGSGQYPTVGLRATARGVRYSVLHIGSGHQLLHVFFSSVTICVAAKSAGQPVMSGRPGLAK